MNEQQWNITGSIHARNAQAQIGFYLALMLISGVPAVAIAWYLSRLTIRWQIWLSLSITSVIWIWLLLEWLGSSHGTFFHTIFLWWLGLILASPLGAVLIQGWRIVFNFLRPRTLDEHLDEQRLELQRQNDALSRKAIKQEKSEYAAPEDFLNLGVFMKGDRFPEHVGVKRTNNWLLLHERLLSQHMLILGTTGAGKTETIKRLVAETLRTTNRDIILVDGKGDDTFALEIAQMIYEARGESVPIFRMGGTKEGSVYHGFRGTPKDIYNRLAALVGVGDVTENAVYFANINRDILQLICFSPQGAPDSFEELLRRTKKTWLEHAYADDDDELEVIRNFSDKNFSDLLSNLRPLARELRSVVDPSGFVLEQTAGAIFSLRTQSVGDTARRFLRFFVEDIKDFVGKRQERPGLLIIDEFGAFQNNSITDVLTLARSANFGVILATQDVTNLGDEEKRQLIMANTRTKILHVSDFPEEIAQLAGTKIVVESSIQHQDGEVTGAGSARPQHQFRVNMNEVGQLKTGEGFIIRQRYAAKFRTKQVAAVVTQPESVAQYPKPEKQKKQPPDAPMPDLNIPPAKKTTKKKPAKSKMPDLNI